MLWFWYLFLLVAAITANLTNAPNRTNKANTLTRHILDRTDTSGGRKENDFFFSFLFNVNRAFSTPALLSAGALLLLMLRSFEWGILSGISATHLATLIKALCSHSCADKRLYRYWFSAKSYTKMKPTRLEIAAHKKYSILNTLAKTSSGECFWFRYLPIAWLVIVFVLLLLFWSGNPNGLAKL